VAHEMSNAWHRNQMPAASQPRDLAKNPRCELSGFPPLVSTVERLGLGRLQLRTATSSSNYCKSKRLRSGHMGAFNGYEALVRPVAPPTAFPPE